MLLLIDSCQNRVSADQYHLNVSQAQFRPIGVKDFLKLLVFKWSQVQVDFFKIQMKYVVFMWLWPRTFKLTSDAKIQPVIYNYRRGRTFLTMVTLYVSFLCADWSQFDRWVHVYAASWNLFTLTAEADRVLCQLVMFLTVFLRWMYKMKFCCYQESSVIHS